MNIRPEVWPTLSQLLDEYLDLAEEARPAWLASLSPVYDTVMAELNQLLDAHRLAAGSGFLLSLPTFTCAAPDPGGSPYDRSEFAPGPLWTLSPPARVKPRRNECGVAG